MIFKKNKIYDWLKFVFQIVLPAFGTLYFALCGIWNFPYGEQVVGTITALVTFAGVVLGFSKKAYDNQNEVIEEDTDDDEK